MANDASSYVEFANRLHAEATELFAVANQEYSSDDAWTTNFDTVAAFMHVAGFQAFLPRHAALTYLMKSIFSIAKGHSERQSMRSRYLDAINYLTFMAWMDENEHTATLTTAQRPRDIARAESTTTANRTATDIAFLIMNAPQENHGYPQGSIEARAQELRYSNAPHAQRFRQKRRVEWDIMGEDERARWQSYNEFLAITAVNHIVDASDIC